MKNKKIGLALGGGAVLGAAHIGVLRVIEKFNIKIDYVAGTSIGALVGAFYAFKKDLKDIEIISEDLKWHDITGFSLNQKGLLSNKKLGDFLTQNIGNVNFEEAEIPLSVVATDISNGKKVVVNKGNLAKGVMASTCIPGIFAPVKIDDRLLVDGGVIEDVPINTVKEMGADFIIAVDLNHKNSEEKPENIVDILLNSFHFSMRTASKMQAEKADLLIRPDLSDFNRISMNQIDDLIDVGYNEALKIFKNTEKNISRKLS